MHEILLRLKSIKSNKTYEVLFDERLSFNENIELLSMAINEQFHNPYIYDPVRKLFINNECKIEDFNISSFMMFYLF